MTPAYSFNMYFYKNLYIPLMKSKYFLRYKFIIEKLQRSQSTSYKEIASFLYKKHQILGYEFSYSKRTFHRDKTEILEIFGIDIRYSKADDSYYIDESEISDIEKKLLDAFLIANAIQLSDDYTKIIDFEMQNIGNKGIFYDLLDAIKGKFRIKLYYQKYYAEKMDEYILEPLALKEFGQRWYLVASNENREYVRTFGLDRILQVEILRTKFDNPNFDLKEFFLNYYGIITDSNTELTEVVLRFDSFQGNYIKSLPLHHSQEIITDNEDELVIKLKLHITFDFKQKLLSFGSFVKVISPVFVKEEIINEYKEALNQYK